MKRFQEVSIVWVVWLLLLLPLLLQLLLCHPTVAVLESKSLLVKLH